MSANSGIRTPRSRPGPPKSRPGPHRFSRGNERDEARKYSQRAIDLATRLVSDYPKAPEYRHLLARCYRQADSRSRRAPYSEPDNLRKAVGILEKLVAEHPDIADYRYDLGETYAALGGHGLRRQNAAISSASKQPPEMFQKALAISERLVSEHPNIPAYAVSSVNIRLRMNPFLRESDSAGAEANLRKALDLQSTLARRFPENRFYTFWMAVIQESLGQILKGQGRLADARPMMEDSIASFRKVLREDIKARHVRGILADNYESLAEVLTEMGEDQGTQEALRQARNLRRER